MPFFFTIRAPTCVTSRVVSRAIVYWRCLLGASGADASVGVELVCARSGQRVNGRPLVRAEVRPLIARPTGLSPQRSDVVLSRPPVSESNGRVGYFFTQTPETKPTLMVLSPVPPGGRAPPPPAALGVGRGGGAIQYFESKGRGYTVLKFLELR